MIHKKLLIVFMFICLFAFSSISYGAIQYICLNLKYDGKNHQYVAQEVFLKVNGKEMNNLTMPPIIFNNYTLVPAREVFEEVGAKVDWDPKAYSVTVKYGDKNVVIKIGDKNAVVNGVTTAMSIPAKIINDKTMIPLRFVSTSVGLGVVWESKSRTALITGNAPEINANITSVTLPSSSNEKFIINSDKVLSGIKPMFLNEGGKRFAIDINNAQIKTVADNINVSESVVSKIRMGQNGNVARVVFDLKSDCEYAAGLSDDKKSVIVTFSGGFTNTTTTTDTTIVTTTEVTTEQTTEQNNTNNLGNNSQGSNNYYSSGDIKYDSYDTVLIIKKNGGKFNINSARHTDNYNNGIYEVVFDGDYRKFVKDAILNINDHNFETIQVSVKEDSLTIIFREKSILSFNVDEDSENIYINALKPKSKYKNIVVLDAGHGGHDSGAMSQGYIEKEITLDIVNRVLELLERDDNIKGYGTRTTDVYPSFSERNNMGNQVGDLFISVHINSASNEKAHGTEVYYHDTTDVTLQRGISSSILASTLHKNLLSKLESFDRKVKRENFIVLRQSDVPASLCEIGFITNKEEGAKLNSPEYRQLVAEAIYESIKELFEQYPER